MITLLLDTICRTPAVVDNIDIVKTCIQTDRYREIAEAITTYLKQTGDQTDYRKIAHLLTQLDTDTTLKILKTIIQIDQDTADKILTALEQERPDTLEQLERQDPPTIRKIRTQKKTQQMTQQTQTKQQEKTLQPWKIDQANIDRDSLDTVKKMLKQDNTYLQDILDQIDKLTPNTLAALLLDKDIPLDIATFLYGLVTGTIGTTLIDVIDDYTIFGNTENVTVISDKSLGVKYLIKLWGTLLGQTGTRLTRDIETTTGRILIKGTFIAGTGDRRYEPRLTIHIKTIDSEDGVKLTLRYFRNGIPNAYPINIVYGIDIDEQGNVEAICLHAGNAAELTDLYHPYQIEIKKIGNPARLIKNTIHILMGLESSSPEVGIEFIGAWYNVEAIA